jgi:type II secretory pathway pseudopilin PulG
LDTNLKLIIALLIALAIIAGLAFYAGRLLFRLRKQKTQRRENIQQRIARITQSIQTISMAVEQQQCNLSEGCIRLCNLLAGVPVANPPNYAELYPAVHELHNKVANLPTHDTPKMLTPNDLRRQDMQREEDEVLLESKILLEVGQLKHFSV